MWEMADSFAEWVEQEAIPVNEVKPNVSSRRISLAIQAILREHDRAPEDHTTAQDRGPKKQPHDNGEALHRRSDGRNG